MTTKDYDGSIIAQTYDEAQNRPLYKEMLDDFAERHSEFERPYAEDEYARVENFYPDFVFDPYTWQPGKLPTDYVRQWRDKGTEGTPRRSGGEESCILACDGAIITDCSKTNRCDNSALGLDIYRVDVVDGVRYVDAIWVSRHKKDDENNHFGSTINIDFKDSAPLKTKVKIVAFTRKYKGKSIMSLGGHECTATFTLKCCDTTTALSFDDASTPDTIARSSSITLYINGTGSTFKWSVGGTGVTLLHAETEGTTNTLTADGTACGAASVTVTDCSGTSTSFEIRVTDASDWCLVDTCAAGSWDGILTCTFIDGEDKWTDDWCCKRPAQTCPGTPPGARCGATVCSEHCSSTDAGCGGVGGDYEVPCWVESVRHWEWKCTPC